MKLSALFVYFETSPAIKLLRSQHAPYVVDFLHWQFKAAERIVVPHSELLPALASYIEEARELDPEVLRDRPETYLTDWCIGERRWLIRRFGVERNEPVYELSPHAEQVLGFLDRALAPDSGFVGTESRLKLVIDILDELVIGASDDPSVHLERLRGERDRIGQQIAQIENDGFVDRFLPARIRERFTTAVSLLKELQGDFRAVEEKFREIAADVQQRQAHGTVSRGGILGDALDAEDALKQEDQGVSFFEFLRFIHSPLQQDRLRAIIHQVLRIEELAEQAEGIEAVRRMVPLLLAEAEKVTQTTRRLTSTLRRLLDVRAQRERRQVAELLRAIQGLAAALAKDPPDHIIGLEVDTRIEIESPLSRTFWTEPARFERLELAEHVIDPERRLALLQSFKDLPRIDWKRLRRQVQAAVARGGSVTLATLLADYPPESGVIDLLGYLQIASDEGHLISREATEEILLPRRRGESRPLAITFPLITFVDKGA